VVSVRDPCARTHHKAPNKRSCERGHVLRSVQRPVHVFGTLFSFFGNGDERITKGWGDPISSDSVAATSVSRSGKPAQAGGTGGGVGVDGRMHGSPRVTALQVTAEAERDA
jgi:hypothetical protein